MTDNDITTSKGVPSISRKTHFDHFFVLALYQNLKMTEEK